MLFRVMARIACPEAQAMVVFFEAPDRFEAAVRLGSLLSLVWDESPSRVEWWQLESELALRTAAPWHGDEALLLTQRDPGPVYADPRHTQLLVGGALHQQLVVAQHRVAARLRAQAQGVYRPGLRSGGPTPPPPSPLR
jgi:hypothetical protein